MPSDALVNVRFFFFLISRERVFIVDTRNRYKFVKQEGRPLPTTVKGWYRGVFVQSSTVAPITAIQMMVNGILGNIVLGGEKRELTDLETIATACGAGVVSALVYSPVDLTTIQQQKLNLNPIDTIKHIARTHGATSLMRGYMACALREGIYTAGYLGLAPVLTSQLVRKVGFFNENPFVASLTGACAAGTVAALLTHPVDTAKTCVQADIANKEGWASARVALPRLISEGGVRSLYQGGLARTLRLCGAFFVCMTLREKAIDFKSARMETKGAAIL